jgi:formylglycine-generating enzyme required for sulfatase activity
VVSWNDAQEFCRWAGKVTGRRVGLPTEAQWEYAARGPNGPKYPWGDKWDGTRLNHADVNWRRGGATVQEWGATNDDDGFAWTAPVGSYKNASWCGAFDMAGGVWQRCEDFYNDKYYQESPALDPKGPGAGDSRVLRGGSWNNGPGNARAAQRHRHDPASRDAGVGFRCAVACDAAEIAGRAALPEAPAPTPAIPANLQKELALNLGGTRMDLVLVPAGEFEMGSNDGDPREKPVHKVKISKPFYIGKYHVTVAQYRRFVEVTKYETEAEKPPFVGVTFNLKGGKMQGVRGNWRDPGFKQEDNHPVVVVPWKDAKEFCKWASGMSGRTVRPPTEAEWEYAARGPQSLKYPWGDQWDGTLANHADVALKKAGFPPPVAGAFSNEDDGYAFTSPVGAYKNASWCGAYDMVGNVWQCCEDLLNAEYYAESPLVDPPGPATGGGKGSAANFHVLRGGSWLQGAAWCRCAVRDPPNLHHTGCCAHYGFRVVVESGLPKTP